MDEASKALFEANHTPDEHYTIPSPPPWVSDLFGAGGKLATMTAMVPQGGFGGLLTDSIMIKPPFNASLEARIPTDIFFAISAMIGKFAIVNFYNSQAFRDSAEGQKWADWITNLNENPSQILNHIWSFAPSATFAFLGHFGMSGCADLLKKLYLTSPDTMGWALKAAPWVSNPYVQIPFMVFPFITNLMGFTHIQNGGVDFIKGSLHFAAENPEYRELREDIACKLEAVRESVKTFYEEGTKDLRDAITLLDETKPGDFEKKHLETDLSDARKHLKNGDMEKAISALDKSRQLSPSTQTAIDNVLRLTRSGQTKLKQATDLLDRIKPEEKTVEQLRETLLKEFNELQLTGASPEPFYRKHAAGLIVMGISIWGLTNFISFGMAASLFFRGKTDGEIAPVLAGQAAPDFFANVVGGMTFCSMMAMATGTYNTASSMVDYACGYRQPVDILSSRTGSSTAGDIAAGATVGVACATGVTPNVYQSAQTSQGIPSSVASALASFALEIQGFWELIKQGRIGKAISADPVAKRIYEADQQMLKASDLKNAKASEVHNLAKKTLPEITIDDATHVAARSSSTTANSSSLLVEIRDDDKEKQKLLAKKPPKEYRDPFFGEIAEFWNKPFADKLSVVKNNIMPEKENDQLNINNAQTNREILSPY